MGQSNYKQLKVWQNAVDLVPLIYEEVKCLPRTETYALGDQIRRAVVSIPSNIAEGQGRQHPKEFLQHLAIAKGSLAELHTLLVVANRLNYLDSERLDELEAKLADVAQPLAGLMKHLRGTKISESETGYFN